LRGLNAGSSAIFSLQLPVNPATVGVSVHAQGVLLDGGAQFTNSLELRLGL
jgi:hypothetical protein